MKVLFIKYLLNVSQGPPNPGIRSVKVQIVVFLEKDSQHFKIYVYFWFLLMPSKPGKQNWKVPILFRFILVKLQCGLPLACPIGLGRSALPWASRAAGLI